jgi:hypothetical protein
MYKWQSAIVMSFVVAVAILGTWKVSQIMQPALWEILIAIGLWLFVVFAAWVLRRNYARFYAEATEVDRQK